jgi:flagellar motor protein MotB
MVNRQTVVIIAVLLFGCTSIFGQTKLTTKNKAAIKLYEDARNNYGLGKVTEASGALLQAIERDINFIEPYLLLGDIYHNQKEHLKELEILKRAVAIDSTFFPSTYLNIGVAAFNAGLYPEAIQWLERFKWRFSDQRSADRVKGWLEKARFATEAVGNTYELELIPAGEGVNTIYDEYWPSITADEQTMVLTVLVPRNPALFLERELPKSSFYFQEDFYMSERDMNGVWQQRNLLLGDINTQSNEGAQTLSADGNWMFFTACGRDDSKGSCDIYFSYKTDTGWSTPKNVGAPVNTPYWESQPCFASDGQTLLFVSNRVGGIGGKDIWQATLQGINSDGTPYFGNIANLGPTINTSKEENSPFLHQDNKTMYFSTDGWPGMGGLDLFLTRLGEDGVWREPVNLGFPINTSGDEIGLVINARGNRAYFSTDGRSEIETGKDIFFFKLPEPLQPTPVLYVKGRVFDAETGVTLPADFQLKDLETGRVVVTAHSNKFTGEFLVCLPVGGRYAFRAEHPGYMFYSGHFDIHKSHPLDEPYKLDIGLNPIKKGAKITLENIFFEVNSYDLQEQSKIELDALVKFMEENKDVKILIGGHTDNVGSEAYNQALSENRAQSVYKYVVSKGIEATRLQYKGFGLNQPIATNETEAGKAKNRRTEITIL